MRAVGYDRDTPNPPGGEIQRDAKGNPTGLLLAKPNAGILYSTLAKGPKLPPEYQLNSTRHFMRELNRLGITGVIDAGGGFQNYPEDYEIIRTLAEAGQMTVRLAYNLFTQKVGEEKEDFLAWTRSVKYRQGDDYFRHNGAGEMLVFSAADFEDFRQPRPDLAESMEDELEEVVRILAENRWPWRLHATYDETISRALDVFEKVDRDIPLAGLNWMFDHAETISERSIDRVAALGGGIATQHRMAYQGEYFVERYGAAAAAATPPISRMLDKGVNVSAGSDATRVASYNPWVSIAWMVTGRTVGGLRVTPAANCLDRETALRMWSEKVAWFSNDEGRRGRIAPGYLADLMVPDRDYFSVPEADLSHLVSDLTMVGGRVVWGSGDFAALDDNPLPPAMPDWSPVRRYGGFAAWAADKPDAGLARTAAAGCGCASACHVHGHDHARAWGAELPVGDLTRAFSARSAAPAGCEDHEQALHARLRLRRGPRRLRAAGRARLPGPVGRDGRRQCRQLHPRHRQRLDRHRPQRLSGSHRHRAGRRHAAGFPARHSCRRAVRHSRPPPFPDRRAGLSRSRQPLPDAAVGLRRHVADRARRPHLSRRHRRGADGADLAGDRARARRTPADEGRRRAQLARYQHRPRHRPPPPAACCSPLPAPPSPMVSTC